MKKDIQSIKDSQQAIQKDLQEIKKLLAARPQAPAGPADPVGVVIDVTGAPFKGDKNAKYTVVEFSEFQCPFCGRHVRDTYPQLDKEYIQPGKVKYVFLDFPLESIHKNAFKAAVAGNCAAEQGKFWEMHDRLFANQQQLEPAQLTEHAKAVGLDASKFQQCLDGSKYVAEIRRDIAEGGKAGVTGTPTTLIGLTQPNGKVKILKAIRRPQRTLTRPCASNMSISLHHTCSWDANRLWTSTVHTISLAIFVFFFLSIWLSVMTFECSCNFFSLQP
jgi:protein-disulfide isomerase